MRRCAQNSVGLKESRCLTLLKRGVTVFHTILGCFLHTDRLAKGLESVVDKGRQVEAHDRDMARAYASGRLASGCQQNQRRHHHQ